MKEHIPKFPLLLIVMLISFCQNDCRAQASEYAQLQAAYLYNFAKYIKWPSESSAFVIGVMAREKEISEIFEKTLRGKKVPGKEIQVRQVSTPDEIHDCHILYVAESESKNISTLIGLLSGKSILLVTEDDLIKKGAMISFIVEEDRLKFKLKKNLMAEAGLIPSEGLLKLAIQL